MEKKLTLLLILTVHLVTVSCYKYLQLQIPNGDRVPDPCSDNANNADVWPGVGHRNKQGGNERNPFGVDFEKHSKIWNREFCMLDSDGDGRTNGEELGDPMCRWTRNSPNPMSGGKITHPGICEPMDSVLCRPKNFWLQCNDMTFTCDEIEKTNAKSVLVKFPKLAVPAKQTTHYCMIFEFPADDDYHVVAWQPKLDNLNVMHHILLNGCDNDADTEHPVGVPYECDLMPDKACRDFLTVWLLGTPGVCESGHAGFRVGPRGYKRGWIQLHWENHGRLENQFDGSGLTMFLTNDRSVRDAGVLIVGSDTVVIPPGLKRHREEGTCPADCTRRKFTKDVHIIAAVNHMHFIGVGMYIEHIRDGKVINVLTNETDYKHDTPITFLYDKPITVRPSDELRTVCFYDSTSRIKTTYTGSGYYNEMCYGFITYYPQDAITVGPPWCTSLKTFPACQLQLVNNHNQCDTNVFYNTSHPVTKHILEKVTRHCKQDDCDVKCSEVITEISEHSCFRRKGDKWVYNLHMSEVEKTDVSKWSVFYKAYDRCSRRSVDGGSPSLGASQSLAISCLVALVVLNFT